MPSPVIARITIAMIRRERHGRTLSALESIRRNTAVPHRLIYVDTRVPSSLREDLLRISNETGLEIAEFEDALWPNQLRKRIVAAINTPYVVFLDNDVSVPQGWLESLIACADDTGAGIVCPVFLIGEAGTTKIHMAGGRLTRFESAEGTVLKEESLFKDQDIVQVGPSLRRREIDFAEYHCVLMRTELAKQPALFDEQIVCVHEHIDTALTAKQAGYSIYFEPSVRVTYAPYALMLSDLAVFRERWSATAVNSSIKAFCAKWGVADDQRSFGPIRLSMAAHRAQFDPLRASTGNSMAGGPMEAHELRQTLSGLFELAKASGYSQDEWEMLEIAHRLALVLMNGTYRPCGRPFINHLVGTASILVRYDFRARVVGAGLLHAAYTHGIESADEVEDGIKRTYRLLGGRESRLEASARAYALRFDRWQRLLNSPRWPEELSIDDAEIVAIAAANEADMHLSGEIRFSGRGVETLDGELTTVVCQLLGVPGLAETLRIEREKLSQVRAKAGSKDVAAFRVVGDRLIPAVNTAAIAALRRRAETSA